MASTDDARRRTSHTAPAASAATTASDPSIEPSGKPAARSATVANHHVRTEVGTCRATATPPRPTAVAAPATSPAPRPHTMSGPAAGTATRLAGTVATGTEPKVASSSGSAPAWAASVTAKSSRTGAGPRSAPRSRGPNTRIPAEADAERPKPSERASNGSTRTRPVTARPSTRMPAAGRPTAAAAAATDVMAAARTTDGSKRTSRQKKPTASSVTGSRADHRRRVSNGPSRTSTNATF